MGLREAVCEALEGEIGDMADDLAQELYDTGSVTFKKVLVVQWSIVVKDE